MIKKVIGHVEYEEGKLWYDKVGTSVTIGITDAGVQGLGQIDDITLPEPGDSFEYGDVVVAIEGTDGDLEVFAPMEGIVEEVNESLVNEPSIVSDDPLEEGWLVKLELPSSKDDDEKEDDEEDDEDEDDDSEEEEEDSDEEDEHEEKDHK